MYELTEKSNRLLDQKIEEVINKGDISPSELDCLYKAAKTKYYLTVTDAMDEGYSYGGIPNNMYPRNDYDDWSMNRGRGGNRSMTNFNRRSYHSVNDRIIANLERELNGDISDYERQEIMAEIQRLREKNGK